MAGHEKSRTEAKVDVRFLSYVIALISYAIALTGDYFNPKINSRCPLRGQRELILDIYFSYIFFFCLPFPSSRRLKALINYM